VKNKYSTVLLVAWFLMILSSAWFVAQTPFVADMSAFLPRNPSPQQQLLVDQLKEGIASRIIIVGLKAGDASVNTKELADASVALAAKLRAQEVFSLVVNAEQQDSSKDQSLLYDYRYHLSQRVDAQHFTAEGLRVSIQDGLAELAMGGGLLTKALFFNDPTGETLALIDHVTPSARPNTLSGVWFSKDQQRAILVLQTKAQGADIDGQQVALNALDSSFIAIAGDKKMVLLKTGAPVYAVQSRHSIEYEAKLFSSLGTFLIVVLLLTVYRSPRLLLLGLIPVVTGALAGLVAVGIGFGNIHGITVGFGVTLIGEAVDYAIYFFIQQGKHIDLVLRQSRFRELFWPTIRLGMLTSICGFCALLFSGFTGLAQLGLFSIAGLMAAALMTRFVLPHWLPDSVNIQIPYTLERAALQVSSRIQSARRYMYLVSAIALVYLAVQGNSIWQNELSALSPVSVQTQVLDATLRGDVAVPEMGYLLLSKTNDEQTALQQSERISTHLDSLINKKILESYESPSTYLASVNTQQLRLTYLPEKTELESRLTLATTGLPVSARALKGFVIETQLSKLRAPLRPEDLKGSAMGAALSNLLVKQGAGYLSYFPVRVASGALFDASMVEASFVAAGISNVSVLNIKAEADGMYAKYVNEALFLSGLGLMGITALLLFTLKSWARTFRVLIPQLLAVLWVIALLTGFGIQLTLLHLVGLLLIVAVGSNYGLFFDQTSRGFLDSKVLISLILANTTTVIGFGILAFSSVPVLQAFGLTVGPGAWFALILSASMANIQTTQTTEHLSEENRAQ
jgi:predicted exporter